MKIKLLLILIILFCLKASATLYNVQWFSGSCGNVSYCSGDTIVFTNWSGTGLAHQQLIINTTTIYDSMSSKTMVYNYVVLSTDTSYDLIRNGIPCSGKIIVHCSNNIENLNNSHSLKIFPNLSSNNIILTSSKNIAVVKIVNVFGQNVNPNTVFPEGEKTVTLNISTLENGIYFITITSGKESSTQKLIVNH